MSTEDEVGVLDHTIDKYLEHEQDSDQAAIRLRSGINVRELLEQEDGVMFEPEIDERLFQDRPTEDRNYFAGANSKDFDQMMGQLNIGDEDEDEDEDGGDEDLSAFQRKAKKMADLLDDGGVKKKVIKHGVKTLGLPPKKGNVTIHFSCYLEDQDEPYDSSILRGRPERFKLDDGRLLPGMEVAVKSMYKDEEAEFMIQPKYAFGEMGCPPRVPQKAHILARITMLAFAESSDAEALLSMDIDERRKAKNFDEIEMVAKSEHKGGNDCVRTDDFKGALRRYEQGIRLLEDAELRNDTDEDRQRNLLLKLYLNKTHSLINLGIPKKACLTAAKILEMDRHNIKALYRMGKAKRMLGNFRDALKYLRRAQQLNPTDTSIGREIVGVEKAIQKDLDNERVLCQNMFGGLPREGGARNESRFGESDDFYSAPDDDFVEDIHMQLEGFKKDKSRDKLYLPHSLNEAEIKFAGKVASSLNLKVEERQNGRKKQLVLVKEEEDDL